MKALLATTAVLSVGFTLGVSQQIQAAALYNGSSAQGTYAPSAANIPPSHQRPVYSEVALDSKDRKESLAEKRRNSERKEMERLEREKAKNQQFQDGMEAQKNSGKKGSAQAGDPALIIQQLQNKADTGQRLTEEEVQQLQNAMEEQEHARGMSGSSVGDSTSKGGKAPAGDSALVIQQLQNKKKTDQGLTEEEVQQLQDAMEAQEHARGESESSAYDPAYVKQQAAKQGRGLTPEELQQIQQYEAQRGSRRESGSQSVDPALGSSDVPDYDPAKVKEQAAKQGRGLTPEELQQIQEYEAQRGSRRESGSQSVDPALGSSDVPDYDPAKVKEQAAKQGRGLTPEELQQIQQYEAQRGSRRESGAQLVDPALGSSDVPDYDPAYVKQQAIERGDLQ